MKWNKYIAGAAGIFLVLSWTFLLRSGQRRIRAAEGSLRPVGSAAGCRQRACFIWQRGDGDPPYGQYHQDHDVHPALEEMEEDQTGRVSEEAAGQPKVRLGVEEGETYRLQDLLYALMLESYNDSAVVIAESLAGSVEAFVEKMNDRAEELGLRDTHFVTPKRAGRSRQRRSACHNGKRTGPAYAVLYPGVSEKRRIPCDYTDKGVYLYGCVWQENLFLPQSQCVSGYDGRGAHRQNRIYRRRGLLLCRRAAPG